MGVVLFLLRELRGRGPRIGRRGFLKSVARRAKYEHLLWRVIAKDHVDFLPRQVVYDGKGLLWEMSYRILSMKPDDKVQIIPKTSIIVKVWYCGHQDCLNYQEYYSEISEKDLGINTINNEG